MSSESRTSTRPTVLASIQIPSTVLLRTESCILRETAPVSLNPKAERDATLIVPSVRNLTRLTSSVPLSLLAYNAVDASVMVMSARDRTTFCSAPKNSK